MKTHIQGRILLMVALVIAAVMNSSAQTTAFAYQGRLTDGGNPASGSYLMQFKLFDASAAGTQVGTTIADVPVTASAGTFLVRLDFGANALSGANRWLEIAVRHNAGEAYVTLSPREQLASAPYSVRTLSATSADALSAACVGCVQDVQVNSISGSKVTGTVSSATNSTQLGGVAANQFVQTNDARLSDARNPLPNSSNYIQNGTGLQTANFNISGSGTLGSVTTGGSLTFNPATANTVAGQSRIFFDSTTNKLKVSENGAAFVDLIGASGISGNGTVNSLPFWTGATILGNSQLSQISGNLAAGNGAPKGKFSIFGAPAWTAHAWGGALDIENASAIAWQANSSGFRQGIGRTTAGLFFFRATSDIGNTATTPVYDAMFDNAGNVGFGNVGLTTTLSSKVNVFADDALRLDGFQPFLTMRDTNSAGLVKKKTFLQGVNGDAVLKTDSGSFLQLQDVTGNVGLGTSTPPHHLSINGGPLWTSNGWFGAISMSNISAIGWDADASGQRFGIGQSTGGLFFFRTNSVLGQTQTPAVYDLQITDNGDLLQARSRAGVAKALLQVSAQGSILRCFNAITGSTIIPCGFSVSMPTAGASIFAVDFGFQVSDRFAAVTPLFLATPTGSSVTSACIVYNYQGNANRIQVFTTALTGASNGDGFTLVIY